ncbi:hypothetical protein [Geoalkalibacter subterraneus]|uniref:Uncharacterized protein n=1 Tax=Geoalkalibacter subterraneus TaxID=483547 RepID=A0A0B5FUD5_9BACT|nr:hypothetical protein [Geoalkalibacter subterraneus]AJF08259.1 hypothetical protein GSUB_17415 [Geoalkalibacter subterraneus]
MANSSPAWICPTQVKEDGYYWCRQGEDDFCPTVVRVEQNSAGEFVVSEFGCLKEQSVRKYREEAFEFKMICHEEV